MEVSNTVFKVSALLALKQFVQTERMSGEYRSPNIINKKLNDGGEETCDDAHKDSTPTDNRRFY